jgi:uncharacterized membrane protein
MRDRFWEIDALRGAGVVAMVSYHLLYDLALFGLYDVSVFRSGLGLFAGRAIGGSFIFLVGLSLTLSYSRSAKNTHPGRGPYLKFLRRGVRICSYGMAITLATWLLVPEEMVVFGILHLIGFTVAVAYPLLRLTLANLVLGFAAILAGLPLRPVNAGHPWFAWLGVEPDFFMIDYWPVFPWLGVALLGVCAGNLLYPEGRRRFTPAPGRIPKWPAATALAFLGRHSLAVYLLHQPLLIAALVLLGLAELNSL